METGRFIVLPHGSVIELRQKSQPETEGAVVVGGVGARVVVVAFGRAATPGKHARVAAAKHAARAR